MELAVDLYKDGSLCILRKGSSETQPRHEDPAQKLQKYADLKQKGVITEEEFKKLKADLLSEL